MSVLGIISIILSITSIVISTSNFKTTNTLRTKTNKTYKK